MGELQLNLVLLYAILSEKVFESASIRTIIQNFGNCFHISIPVLLLLLKLMAFLELAVVDKCIRRTTNSRNFLELLFKKIYKNKIVNAGPTANISRILSSGLIKGLVRYIDIVVVDL